MTITRYPHGVSSYGIPLFGGGYPLGPGCGDVYYTVAAKASTDLYYMKLVEHGVDEDHIFTTLADAYAATTAAQNDVVAMLPGLYTVTASLAWAKSATHLVGLGGPNQRYGRSAGTDAGMVALRCTTSAVDSILNVTGHYVHISGIDTCNNYSGNDNRCDIMIAGRNTYISNCAFRGGNGADQLNHLDAGVAMIIDPSTLGGGNGLKVVNTHFGNSSNTARSVGASWIYVLTSGGVLGGYFQEFENCRFETRIETASSATAGIMLASGPGIARSMLFKDCFFYNFWINHAGHAYYVVVDATVDTHDIVFMNCAQQNFFAWSNSAAYCFTNSPIANTDGGECLATSATAS